MCCLNLYGDVMIYFDLMNIISSSSGLQEWRGLSVCLVIISISWCLFKYLKEKLPSDKNVDHKIAFISQHSPPDWLHFLKGENTFVTNKAWNKRRFSYFHYLFGGGDNNSSPRLPRYSKYTCLLSRHQRVWKLRQVPPGGRNPSPHCAAWQGLQWEVRHFLWLIYNSFW